MTDAQLLELYRQANALTDYLYETCGVRDLLQRQAAAPYDGPDEPTDRSGPHTNPILDAMLNKHLPNSDAIPDDLSDARDTTEDAAENLNYKEYTTTIARNQAAFLKARGY